MFRDGVSVLHFCQVYADLNRGVVAIVFFRDGFWRDGGFFRKDSVAMSRLASLLGMEFNLFVIGFATGSRD